MARPSHELKPGEQSPEPAPAAEEAPARKFPGFPFYRSGPNQGKRRYPNPLRANRPPKEEKTEDAVAGDGARRFVVPENMPEARRRFLATRGALPWSQGEEAPPAEAEAAVDDSAAPEPEKPTRPTQERPTPPAEKAPSASGSEKP